MINCPICSEISVLTWKERKNRMYRCRKCGVAFIHPIPENPSAIYSEDYFRKWYIKYYWERKACTENLFLKVEEYAGRKGKLLDVGCGAGILLDVARERGWEVYGQDVSPFAVDYCRKKGFVVHEKPLSELVLQEGSFDLITMFDVIAHLRDPAAYIRGCRKFLRPGGFLVIKTPCHSRLLFFTANLLSFTGRSRTLLHVPAQIFHFNENSLKEMCGTYGLELLKVNRMNDFYALQNRDFLHIIFDSFWDNKSVVTIWVRNAI